jgi:PAS domain S-box-containing protein
VLTIGAGVLVGLVSGVLLAIWLVAPGLKSFSAVTMKANTSLGLLLASSALLLLRSGPSWVARILGGVVLVLGLATLAQYAFTVDLGIDELVATDFRNLESRPHPGRMSPLAAASFAALGSALLLVDGRSRPRQLALAVIVALLLMNSLVALAGYFYGVGSLYAPGPFIRIAWQTAAAFFVLGVGIITARPESGPLRLFVTRTPAGLAARRLLPAVVFLPLLLGWFALRAQHAGIDANLSTSLYAVSLVVVLALVVAAGTRSLELTERERERSEQMFRSFFHLGLVGTAQTDPATGRFLVVNSRMEELTGYSAEELKGLTFSDITHPEDRERDRATYAELASGKHPVHVSEKRYVRKDGRTIWVLVNAALVRDEAGAPLRTVKAIQDISFLKEAQDKLSEALRLREEFLSIASHELRTPLTAILLQIQGLERALGKDPAVAKYVPRLGKALDSGARLEKLINELLDVSRLTAGRLRLEPEELDLAVLVEEVAGRFRESARAGVTVDAPSLPGCFDRMRLEQVLTNLIGNAVKYGAGKPVDVTLRRDGEDAVIVVVDRGIGIAPADQAAIFERFGRAVGSREFAGFGLGLWIAREIVNAAGGTIAVESVVGDGSRFTVRLPVRPTPA